MRLKGKERHDDKHSICVKELTVGQVVLLHDTRREKDMSRNMFFKWLGPYRVCDAVKDKGTYMLKEFDGFRLSGMFAGDRLRYFTLGSGFI